MAQQRLRICLATSEFSPLAKTGGLADVSGALSKYLHENGHDVRVLVPSYARIESSGIEIEPVKALTGLSMQFGSRTQQYSIGRLTLPDSGLPVYVLRCDDFYGRDGIYTQDDDEYLRFVFLSRAAIEMCQKLNFAPDIFSCHDWQTALIPLYLRSVYAWDKLFAKTRTVLTIHNIGYQGRFPASVLNRLNLADAANLLHQDDLKDGVINFLKTGILYAHLITTVSPTYAREILGDDYGMGLNHLLRSRMSSVVGILNGVDYDEWDPATDPLIPANYTPDDTSGKAVCKAELMREMGLDVVAERPLFGIVSRLVWQKGLELVEQVLPRLLLTRNLAVAVLGSGEPRYEEFFARLQDRFGDKARFYRGYNNQLAHMIEAGADAFLMPSLYEPCGLNQMYSLKYGTVPVVRETGGLADSVEQIDADRGTGNGILFRDFNATGFDWAMQRALSLYDDRPLWQKAMANGMAADFSWQRQGAHYVDLFEKLRRSA